MNFTGQALLTWEAPNNPDFDTAGYKVYHSTTPGIVLPGVNVENVNVGNVLTYTWLGLSTGGSRHYFVVTAVDLAGNESIASNEVSKKIDDIVGGGHRHMHYTRRW